jgi:hypothetical protein
VSLVFEGAVSQWMTLFQGGGFGFAPASAFETSAMKVILAMRPRAVSEKGVLACNVTTAFALSVRPTDVRGLGQPPPAGRDRVAADSSFSVLRIRSLCGVLERGVHTGQYELAVRVSTAPASNVLAIL